MATLVLGTVGRAVGGRIGGVLGTMLGSALDRRVLGGGATREGPRLGSLAVQSSAYGEPMPRLYGRMRVAGNLVWSTGIRETRQRSGGGKRGPATSSYSYSASFAVIVAARPIVRVGRIWADGKLLRDADGAFIVPVIVRTHHGGDDQPVDPLIAAAEGIDFAPAYRGRAYVVFEDLPLADYGNRIPNLTFEVVADGGDDAGVEMIVADIAAAAGVTLAVDYIAPRVHGFVATSRRARDVLASLDAVADLSLHGGGQTLAVRFGSMAPSIVVPRADMGATTEARGPMQRDSRAAPNAVPDTLTLEFSDPARDYQAGMQRAVRRTPSIYNVSRGFDGALTAAVARQSAETMLRRAVAARTTGTITLPWRHAAITAGDTIAIGLDAAWRVRTRTIVGLVVELDVERVPTPAAPVRPVDPGRVNDPGDRPAGPTRLHVLDLPPLSGALPTTPRLWLAAAGSGRWTGAEILVSTDDGDSYAQVATVGAPAAIGVALGALAPGCTDRWDRRSSVEVEMLDASMWLEARSEAAVLGGANLALVGDEIIQFADVVVLGPNRFRLSMLLRGRRGTEASMTHAAGDRFVLLDPATLAGFDPPLDAVGVAMLVKAVPAGAAPPASEIRLAGRALRPLSPVFLRVARAADGAIEVGWTRRSRSGFAWTDGVDAALAEESERYRIEVAIDGSPVRALTVATPHWRYTSEAIAIDGGLPGTVATIAVAQLGVAGPGDFVSRSLAI